MKRGLTRLWLILLPALLWVACGTSADKAPDEGALNDLAIKVLAPEVLLPGTTIVVEGSFGDVILPLLELEGQFQGQTVRLSLSGDLIGPNRMEVPWPGGPAAGLPSGEGTFEGTARVSATGPVDGRLHLSQPQPAVLDVTEHLDPQLSLVFEGVIFINDQIEVEGEGFLLGGSEGTTVAILEGCFTPQGASQCEPIGDVEVPMTPEPATQRGKATFPFAPKIAGIEPGQFSGSLRVRNDHAQSGSSLETKQIPVDFEILPPKIFEFNPAKASLGQYVNITGGGFVGEDPDVPDENPAVTTIKLEGTFTAAGAPSGTPVTVTLVPEFFEGRTVRYVLNEEDELGSLANLREVTGEFVGAATPTTKYAISSVTGAGAPVTLGIAPIKQVVLVTFLPSYVDSLKHFGLRSVDQRIRDRIFEVLQRDYVGINVEFRAEPPEDFALYAQVELAGKDPNGLALLGYDNSPGKDVDCTVTPCIYNRRLYDKIGGVNAKTQEDGYPGYGGVFVESLFGFSQHPGKFADALDVADPLFDQSFDPFRPDRGGRPVVASDLLDLNIPVLDSGAECPAKERGMRIACAVWVLGSLIGTTTSHEVAHSLGLAEPDGSDFHNSGDEPNRLMDSGAARTFSERSELVGDGPSVFCDDDYTYLKKILPNPVPDPLQSRPGCY